MQCRIVIDHDHARPDRGDRLPDPVLVVINIDTEQIDLPGHATLRDQCIDVLGVDEGVIDRQPALSDERLEIDADGGDVLLGAFEPNARLRSEV